MLIYSSMIRKYVKKMTESIPNVKPTYKNGIEPSRCSMKTNLMLKYFKLKTEPY